MRNGNVPFLTARYTDLFQRIVGVKKQNYLSESRFAAKKVPELLSVAASILVTILPLINKCNEEIHAERQLYPNVDSAFTFDDSAELSVEKARLMFHVIFDLFFTIIATHICIVPVCKETLTALRTIFEWVNAYKHSNNTRVNVILHWMNKTGPYGASPKRLVVDVMTQLNYLLKKGDIMLYHDGGIKVTAGPFSPKSPPVHCPLAKSVIPKYTKRKFTEEEKEEELRLQKLEEEEKKQKEEKEAAAKVLFRALKTRQVQAKHHDMQIIQSLINKHSDFSSTDVASSQGNTQFYPNSKEHEVLLKQAKTSLLCVHKKNKPKTITSSTFKISQAYSCSICKFSSKCEDHKVSGIALYGYEFAFLENNKCIH